MNGHISVMACLLLYSLNSMSCPSYNKQYFSLHPKALQTAIEQCPSKPPSKVSCEELQIIAMRVSQFANELRMSPQGFGQSILRLQEAIAKQENDLTKNGAQPELKDMHKKNQQELQERLAVANWLESPES